jgi:hypothetical protein
MSRHYFHEVSRYTSAIIEVYPMNDPHEYTTEQLQRLAEMMPSQVRIDEGGRIVPLITREEVRALAQRFPSNFRGPPEVPAGADPALIARFPTMFKTK